MVPHNSSRGRAPLGRAKSATGGAALNSPVVLEQTGPLLEQTGPTAGPQAPEADVDTVQTLLHHEVSAAVAAEVAAATESASPETDRFPETTVDVEELIAGLIAAHDLASIPGSSAIQVQLERTLRAAGLTRIRVQEGQPFDPDEQMVAAIEPAVTEEQDRCVAREIRSGWKRRNQVVRPAEVAVWTIS